MSLKEKPLFGFAFLIQGVRRKAAINTRCLCVWPRGWAVHAAWMFSTVEWLWMVFLGYTAVLGFGHLRKLWEREGDTEGLNLWSQRNLILAIKTTAPIDFTFQSRLSFSSNSNQFNPVQSNPICIAYPICQEMLLLLSSEYNQNATSSFHPQTCCLCLATICCYLGSELGSLLQHHSFILTISHDIYLLLTICYYFFRYQCSRGK